VRDDTVSEKRASLVPLAIAGNRSQETSSNWCFCFTDEPCCLALQNGKCVTSSFLHRAISSKFKGVRFERCLTLVGGYNGILMLTCFHSFHNLAP